MTASGCSRAPHRNRVRPDAQALGEILECAQAENHNRRERIQPDGEGHRQRERDQTHGDARKQVMPERRPGVMAQGAHGGRRPT